MARCKKTNNKFKQEVTNLVGDEYEFLDPYVNSKTKIRVKHNKCGNIYKVKPSNFLSGKRCPYCANLSRKGKLVKTDSQFKREVYSLVGDEYTFLDTYVNNHTKLKVRHNKCGNTYDVSPNSFLRGHYCPYCKGNIKRTNEQFQQEVTNLVGNEYIFLDIYINNSTKLRVKHTKCGNIYRVTPNSFLRGHRCPYCFGTPKKTNEQFKKEVYGLVGNEYTFLDIYVNADTKIKVKHNKCEQVYKVTPSNFIRGSRCPYCSANIIKTNSRFKREVEDLVGNEYTFLDYYRGAFAKIKVKHNKCGNIYEVRPTDFISHQSRCPYCNSPKGETIIGKILDSLNIDYEYQKTFSNLKDVQPLSYDFFIPDQAILIEYQGKQHYQAIDYFGGEDQFKLQRKHDKMKADYAKGHSYNLIAIPYTEDTFTKIKKYLLQHGLIK